jgi:hypothetical protein
MDFQYANGTPAGLPQDGQPNSNTASNYNFNGFYNAPIVMPPSLSQKRKVSADDMEPTYTANYYNPQDQA